MRLLMALVGIVLGSVGCSSVPLDGGERKPATTLNRYDSLLVKMHSKGLSSYNEQKLEEYADGSLGFDFPKAGGAYLTGEVRGSATFFCRYLGMGYKTHKNYFLASRWDATSGTPLVRLSNGDESSDVLVTPSGRVSAANEVPFVSKVICSPATSDGMTAR